MLWELIGVAATLQKLLEKFALAPSGDGDCLFWTASLCLKTIFIGCHMKAKVTLKLHACFEGLVKNDSKVIKIDNDKNWKATYKWKVR